MSVIEGEEGLPVNKSTPVIQKFLSELAKKLSHIDRTQMTHVNASHFEPNIKRIFDQIPRKSPNSRLKFRHGSNLCFTC